MTPGLLRRLCATLPARETYLCIRRRDAAPDRSGAGSRAGRRRCGAIASAGCMAPGGGAPRGNRNARKHGEFAAETLAMKKTNQRPRSAGPRDNGRDRIARRALAPVRSTGVRAPGASAHIRSSSLKRRSHRTASAAVKPEAIALTGSWRAESFLRRRLVPAVGVDHLFAVGQHTRAQ
jgi:hypothetical protein